MAEFDPNAPFELDSGSAAFDPNAPFEAEGKPKAKGPSADKAGVRDYALAPVGGFNKTLALPLDIINSIINAGWQHSPAAAVMYPKGDAPPALPTDNAAKIGKFFNSLSPSGLLSGGPATTQEYRSPDTPLGRGLNRVGEELGANVVPSAGILRAAGAAKYAPNLAMSTTSFVDRLMGSIARSPNAAARGEIAATIGSGTGAAIAQEKFPGNPAAEATGQVVGGFSPAVPGLLKYTLTGQLVKQGANALGDMASAAAKPFAVENPQTMKEKLINWAAELGKVRKEAKGRDIVKKVIGNELGPDEMAQLKQAEELKNEIPGFNPSVAEATGSPSLIAQQVDLEARTPAGKDLNTIVRRREGNQQAIDTFAAKNAPGTEAPPEFVVDSAARTVRDLRHGVEQEAQNLAVERGGVASQLPTVDKQAAGITFKEQLDAAREARRRDLDKMKDSLGLNNVDVTIPFTDISRRLASKFSPDYVVQDMGNYPEVVAAIRQRGEPVPVSVKNQGQAKFTEAVSRMGRNGVNAVDAVYNAVKASGGNWQSVMTSPATWDMAEKIAASARKGRQWAGPEGAFQHLVNGVWDRMGIGDARYMSPQLARRVANARGGAGTMPGPDEFKIRGREGDTIYKDAKMSFDELTALRERVSDDLIAARAGSPGGGPPKNKQISMLAQMKEDIDGVISKTLESVDPSMRDAAKQYRAAYFKQLVEPFEQGAVAKVRGMDGQAFYRTQPEKVADAFFQKGNTSAVDQFNEIYAGNPEAQKTMRDVALDRMREATVREGQVDPQRLQKWVSDHRSVLSRLPEISNEIVSVQAANDAIIQRQTQLAVRQQTIEDQLLTRVTDSYGRGLPAQSVIDGALKDPRKMGQLISAARQTEGALPALERNVWKQATTGSAEDVMRFMSENEAALTKLFGKEHLDNIAKIATARMMVERVPVAEGTAWVPRPLENIEKQIGVPIPSLLGRWHTLITGRSQKEWVVAETALRALRGRAALGADDAMRAALYDFNTARDFAKALEPNSMDVYKAKQIYSRLFALGIPLTERDE